MNTTPIRQIRSQKVPQNSLGEMIIKIEKIDHQAMLKL